MESAAHCSRHLVGRALRVLVAVLMAVTFTSSAGCSRTAVSSATEPSKPGPVTLNVSAAASLKSVLTDIAPSFETANGVKLVFNFGASGVLMKQIESGSPTDVFLSAGALQVDTLTAKGLISAEQTETFAGNDLVILVPAGNPRGIHGQNDLANATKLATGDPAVAPHGAAAREWLVTIGLWKTLEPRFVFAASAPQTDDYVARGEVDAGIGFASDAAGRGDLEVAYVVPAAEYKLVKYVAAPVKESKQTELGSRFVTYLLTPGVQSALKDAGFKPAPAKQ